jgi:hypothetical protein
MYYRMQEDGISKMTSTYAPRGVVTQTEPQNSLQSILLEEDECGIAVLTNKSHSFV